MKYLFILALFTSDLWACMMLEELSEKTKKSAEIVFMGRIHGFDLASDGKSAKLKFTVVKQIKGDLDKGVEATLLKNINTSIPKNISDFKKCYGEETEVGIKKLKTHFEIVSDICNPPYMIPKGGSYSLEKCSF